MSSGLVMPDRASITAPLASTRKWEGTDLMPNSRAMSPDESATKIALGGCNESGSGLGETTTMPGALFDSGTRLHHHLPSSGHDVLILLGRPPKGLCTV